MGWLSGPVTTTMASMYRASACAPLGLGVWIGGGQSLVLRPTKADLDDRPLRSRSQPDARINGRKYPERLPVLFADGEAGVVHGRRPVVVVRAKRPPVRPRVAEWGPVDHRFFELQ